MIVTFWIFLQQEVEVAELAEDIRIHLALCFQDEAVVAAHSLKQRHQGESSVATQSQRYNLNSSQRLRKAFKCS